MEIQKIIMIDSHNGGLGQLQGWGRGVRGEVVRAVGGRLGVPQKRGSRVHQRCVGDRVRGRVSPPVHLKLQRSPCFKMAQKLDLRYVFFDPSTFSAGGKTCLESSVKKFKPHLLYRPGRERHPAAGHHP